ncbi:VOC family protein [Histidinibacterium aquaticum]|uniref:VOC family protein n=1 Tax=Histidinibacterium aquaticum TaxID=2613962 RepID=A0A5J5GS47_9RHOB|nr:VOC family protein [Histidinibacterium aquaticum]KAA9010493.1 VOC family protein [Histidinibacterium aquaticum]
MAERIQPFLMFQGGRAGEAMEFYTSLFDEDAVLVKQTFGPEGPGPEGTVMLGSIRIAGQTVLLSDSPIEHGFDFTPSSSLFVTCTDAPELDRLAAALEDGGVFLMEPGDHGFSRRFAWVQDRFGVSWQLNLE